MFGHSYRVMSSSYVCLSGIFLANWNSKNNIRQSVDVDETVIRLHLWTATESKMLGVLLFENISEIMLHKRVDGRMIWWLGTEKASVSNPVNRNIFNVQNHNHKPVSMRREERKVGMNQRENQTEYFGAKRISVLGRSKHSWTVLIIFIRPNGGIRQRKKSMVREATFEKFWPNPVIFHTNVPVIMRGVYE